MSRPKESLNNAYAQYLFLKEIPYAWKRTLKSSVSSCNKCNRVCCKFKTI